MSGLGPNYRKLWFASVVSNLGDGVSLIAYPWLASALTRDPVAIAGVGVANRLPWLLVTLPAGVLTDRVDRRRLVAGMDAARFVLTTLVAVALLLGESGLADPADVADGLAGTPDRAGLWLALLYAAAALLGTAEVLRDNAAQTLMPAIVAAKDLERANGRLWGAELTMNSFVGPPLAGILLGGAFALPFLLDAGSFAVAAGLVFWIAGDLRPRGRDMARAVPWRTELREGVAWLWRHPLLRSLAVALGLINGLGAMNTATEVLFAQEVLGLGATGFGLLLASAAVGGVVSSLTSPWVSQRLGSGPSLFATILVASTSGALIALLPSVPLVFALFVLNSYFAVLWNVITVSLRQTIIPDHLLGRVNSVYRFFGWGMIPLGTLAGGALVALVDVGASRDVALRAPFAASAVVGLLVYAYALPRLNSSRIAEARRAAGAPVGEG